MKEGRELEFSRKTRRAEVGFKKLSLERPRKGLQQRMERATKFQEFFVVGEKLSYRRRGGRLIQKNKALDALWSRSRCLLASESEKIDRGGLLREMIPMVHPGKAKVLGKGPGRNSLGRMIGRKEVRRLEKVSPKTYRGDEESELWLTFSEPGKCLNCKWGWETGGSGENVWGRA